MLFDVLFCCSCVYFEVKFTEVFVFRSVVVFVFSALFYVCVYCCLYYVFEVFLQDLLLSFFVLCLLFSCVHLFMFKLICCIINLKKPFFFGITEWLCLDSVRTCLFHRF